MGKHTNSRFLRFFVCSVPLFRSLMLTPMFCCYPNFFLFSYPTLFIAPSTCWSLGLINALFWRTTELGFPEYMLLLEKLSIHLIHKFSKTRQPLQTDLCVSLLLKLGHVSCIHFFMSIHDLRCSIQLTKITKQDEQNN